MCVCFFCVFFCVSVCFFRVLVCCFLCGSDSLLFGFCAGVFAYVIDLVFFILSCRTRVLCYCFSFLVELKVLS